METLHHRDAHDALDHQPSVSGRAALAAEIPVALTYQGSTHAVLMASPFDLEDFAHGFSISEGIVDRSEQIEEMSVLRHARGIEIRMWLAETASGALERRRRRLLGPVGCGLCGLDSLSEALAPPRRLAADVLRLSRRDVGRAVTALEHGQQRNRLLRSLHAAGLWSLATGTIVVREDVGRHNALDKIVGAASRSGIDPRGSAAIVTSRVSVDLVQKVARLGTPVLIAVSAPTELACSVAQDAGITLAARVRRGAFQAFSHPERLTN